MSRDYDCNVWEADTSIIPPNTKVPSNDDDDDDDDDDRCYFYIKILADFSTYLVEGEEGIGYGLPTSTFEETEHVKAFQIPSDELINESSSWSTISTMLSAVDIPMDAQPNMVHRISDCAWSMAKASHNVGSKVLPMVVQISIEDFFDEDDDGAVLRASTEGTVGAREGPASKESVEALETVKSEGGLGVMDEQCAICQEDLIMDGLKTKRMPCGHVYHGDCIVRWLSVSNLCPLCRFRLPT